MDSGNDQAFLRLVTSYICSLFRAKLRKLGQLIGQADLFPAVKIVRLLICQSPKVKHFHDTKRKIRKLENKVLCLQEQLSFDFGIKIV